MKHGQKEVKELKLCDNTQTMQLCSRHLVVWHGYDNVIVKIWEQRRKYLFITVSFE